jgi:DNA-binding Lrp family transcriptional regulator
MCPQYHVRLLISTLNYVPDGRKSFRQISRETGISTPTVKARFDRLVNIGFIKSVSPILDFKKVDYNGNPVIDNMLLQATKNKRQELENNIKKGILVDTNRQSI